MNRAAVSNKGPGFIGTAAYYYVVHSIKAGLILNSKLRAPGLPEPEGHSSVFEPLGVEPAVSLHNNCQYVTERMNLWRGG